jgi:hypothetical protein
MLILVPWKPFVFGWLLLTAMILAGYAVYCIQEDRNPFSVEKNHLQRAHLHRAAGDSTSPQRYSRLETPRPRHDPGSSNASHRQHRSGF